jgi:hypothetical protein
VHLSGSDHPRGGGAGRCAGRPDAEAGEHLCTLATEVEGVRALVEAVAASIVGGRSAAEPAAALMDGHRATRAGNDRRRSEAAETAADDVDITSAAAPSTVAVVHRGTVAGSGRRGDCCRRHVNTTTSMVEV